MSQLDKHAEGSHYGFATTRWSVIAAAGELDSDAAREALAVLCQAYWRPLYAYVRRRVSSEHEAQDLTQGFFVQLLERNDFAVANPDRGRFRAFLLTALKHFLANQGQRARAKKRGDGQVLLSLDFQDGESQQGDPVDDSLTPEEVFQRHWVTAILGVVLDQLRDEYHSKGQLELFEELKPHLAGSGARGSYAELATRLDRGEGALRMAVQRMRARYRELLRQEIAQTVRNPEDVDEEIASLFAALRPTPKIL
jgi:RNA polymerase sigma-70 factor (ECF subfamily)